MKLWDQIWHGRETEWKRSFLIYGALGLCFHLLAAYFSEGFHRPDEYLGIIQWMDYKLGGAPESLLSWEFGAQIRPWLQPGFYYAIALGLKQLGILNPFVIAFFLRLISSLIGYTSILMLGIISYDFLQTKKWRSLVLAMLALLWFLPFFHARTTAESFGASFFIFACFGLYLYSPKQLFHFDKQHPTQTWTLPIGLGLIVGLMLGFSFEFRYQMAVSIACLGLWFLSIGKLRWSSALPIITGFVVIVGLSVLVNRWGYGVWTFSPWNYYYHNIVLKRAASFGVDPWWKYFELVVGRGMPPLSLLFLLTPFWLMVKRPKHLLNWIVFPFFIFHSAIGHKEARFLFPLGPWIPLVIGPCLEQLTKIKNIPRWISILLITENSLLLLATCLRPAYSPIDFYRYVYDHQEKIEHIVTLNLIRDQMHFYQARPIQLEYLESFDDALKKVASDRPTWILTDQYDHIKKFRELTYCNEEFLSYPRWTLDIKLGNWPERSKIWGFYRCQLSSESLK